VLILTRKAEQGIVIDHVTIVRILSIDGDRVKIGIDAPTSIPVLREELLIQGADDSRESSRAAGTWESSLRTGVDSRRGPQAHNGNGTGSGGSRQAPRDVRPD